MKASIYVLNDLAILMEGEGGISVDVALYSLAEALSDLQLVIRIVFSLLMSSSSGGLSRPPAVR